MEKLLYITIILLTIGCEKNSTEAELPYKNLEWIQIGYWDKISQSTQDDGVQYNHQSMYLGGGDYYSCESVNAGSNWPSWMEIPLTSECGWEEDEYWTGLDTDDGVGFDATYSPNCSSSDDIKSTEIHYYEEEKYVEYVKLGDTEKSVFDIESYENSSYYCGVFINYVEK